MKIRIYILSTTLFFITIMAFGQSNSKKIYLKDGSIIEGQIIEDTDYYVKIINQANDTIEVGHKLISSVGKPIKANRIRPAKIIKTNGIATSVMGSLLLSSDNSNELYAIQITLAKRIMNGRGNIGLALAYDRIEFISNFNNLETQFLSPALYGRYNLNMRKTRILIDGKVGYSLALSSINTQEFEHEYKGEINSSLGLGLHFPSSKNVSFLLRSGVQYIRTSGEFGFTRGSPNTTAYNRRFIHPYIGIAIEF